MKVIAYLMSPLMQSAIRSRGKPVKITGSVKEEELSAMEPGDVCTFPFYIHVSCLRKVAALFLLGKA